MASIKELGVYLISIMLSIGLPCLLQAQSEKPEEYLNGIKFLAANDTAAAESCLISSIAKHRDADSYYQLGKIQAAKKTYKSRNDALENLKQASLRKPDNLIYRLDYLRLLEEFAIYSAINGYKKLTEEFKESPIPWIRLGEINLKGFNEYKDSKKIGKEEDPRYDFDLSETAKQDFLEAQSCFINALRVDSLNYDAMIGLSRLYENSNNEKRAVAILKKLIRRNPADKNARLWLGMIYHRFNKPGEASKEFEKAISLMTYEEREDFIYNSVVKIITPAYGEEIERLSKEEIESAIARFWKVSNPLLLSEYNERLLEHYSRMAYSNLYFSVPKLGIEGWKTDRGEVYLRYGEPLKKTKIRPYISNSGFMTAKSDIWNYDGFELSFDDYAMNGDFKLSWERGNSERFGSGLRSNIFSFELFGKIKEEAIQLYKPKGKQFNINLGIYSFVNFSDGRKNSTDSYLAYEIPVRDSTGKITGTYEPFETGLFIFDRMFNPVFEKRSLSLAPRIKSILDDNRNRDKIETIKFTFPADTVSFAFEARKQKDSSFFSNHSLLGRKTIKEGELNLSDLVLASAISVSEEIPGAVKRDDYYIMPRINAAFKNNEEIYLYYEAYNLSKREDNLNDFEQIITVQEHKEEQEGGGLKKLVLKLSEALFGESNKLSLSSSYRTAETNCRQYIQLDLSKLSPGRYDLIVEVFDKITGKRTSETTVMDISDK